MKKTIHTLLVLTGIVLLASIGTAQAAQSRLSDPTGALSIASAYPAQHWETGFIHTQSSAGSHVSLAFDPDHNQAAWVSYHNETDDGLWAAHYVGVLAGNCGPQDSWKCEAVDQVVSESKGLYTSIDVYPDTNPAPILTTWKVGISYYDATHKSLKYAQYRCPVFDPCYWTIQTVHSSADMDDDNGRYTSMKFDSTGIPHISYFGYLDATTVYLLNYAYFKGGSAGNCGDDNDWQCEPITWGSPLGLYTALDIDWQDQIYIAHYDEDHQRLGYATSFGMGNCGPGTAWHCEAFEHPLAGNQGLFPAVSAPRDAEDLFRIAFYDSTRGSLIYMYQRDDYDGNCGHSDTWQCETIDSMGSDRTWASISMAVDSAHNPMIAYSDVSEELLSPSLKVAEPADGQPYANCGSGAWWCGRLDSGNTFFDKARYASLGIKPDGLAMIAYSSRDRSGPGDYNLKFAYQSIWIFLPVTLK